MEDQEYQRTGGYTLMYDTFTIVCYAIMEFELIFIAWCIGSFVGERLFEAFMRMPMGTRSLLCGAHCFFLHPFFVAAGWIKLYGFPFDPRIWFAFFLHDIGYWGCHDLDGKEGWLHPERGARIMHWLFGRDQSYDYGEGDYFWHGFTLYHSREYAIWDNEPVSRLCLADKLAFKCQWKWLYLKMVNFTGEIYEYRDKARNAGLASHVSDSEWYDFVSRHGSEYAFSHLKDVN